MTASFTITDYATLVFDCDGVILNSNQVKSEAFYQATLPYGEAPARAMVDYHVAHGGVSRYKKFAYFLEDIAPAVTGPNLDELLQSYASYVQKGLLCCEIAPGMEALRKKTSNTRWLVVSGGDQTELRDVFAKRGIASWFDGGIFGSPDTKEKILNCELLSDNIQQPTLFLGDSKYDYQAASTAGMDFIFLSDWSEVRDWELWCKKNNLAHINNIGSLLAVTYNCKESVRR